MDERPGIEGSDSGTFLSYYYLKEEMEEFCRRNGLQVSGRKEDLKERIVIYLDTGRKTSKKAIKKNAGTVSISDDSVIGEHFSYSESNRKFFEERIGKGFRFAVPFQKWLRDNPEKTCGDAVKAYEQVMKDAKNNKCSIDKQFEYNTYIRDFFADNDGMSLNDAIRCWKYKKSIKGHNSYERTDLSALTE